MPPRVASLSNGQGSPGSTVFCFVFGTGLEVVSRVSFSGSGLAARILRPPSAGTIALSVSIATDASPGSRRVLLTIEDGTVKSSPALFHVFARSNYAGTSGIGSHLI